MTDWDSCQLAELFYQSRCLMFFPWWLFSWSTLLGEGNEVELEWIRSWAMVQSQQHFRWPHEGLEALTAFQSCPELGKECLAFITLYQPGLCAALGRGVRGGILLGKVTFFSPFLKDDYMMEEENFNQEDLDTLGESLPTKIHPVAWTPNWPGLCIAIIFRYIWVWSLIHRGLG